MGRSEAKIENNEEPETRVRGRLSLVSGFFFLVFYLLGFASNVPPEKNSFNRGLRPEPELAFSWATPQPKADEKERIVWSFVALTPRARAFRTK